MKAFTKLFIPGFFIIALFTTSSLFADEPVHPQSPEAIKQMADELEADRKAREAARSEPGVDTQGEMKNSHKTDSIPATKADLERLRQQCEDAREKLIAPLKKKAIEECIAKKAQTPEQCEQFYADYGNPGVTKSGGFRQRIFHDIPECQPYYEAEKKLSNTK